MLSLIGWAPGPWELMIVAAVAFLFFGHRLPSMMKSLGQGVNSFKAGLREGEAEPETASIEQQS
jgi:sec-independent protein translocase protein TatA